MASDHPNNNMGNERSGGSSNSSSSNSSGKKVKNKSGGSNSDKPKQPQRGLGVAQLEKIRLHSHASCGFIPSPQHPFCPPMPFPNPTFQHMQEEMRMHAGYQAALQQANAMSFGSSPPPQPMVGSSPSYGYHPGSFMERASNIRYGTESQACNTARWNPNNNVIHLPESHQYAQPPGMVTRHLLSHVEE